MMAMILAIDAAQRLGDAGDELNTALEFYVEWGKDLGLALFSCCMAASLLGLYLKSM